MLVDERLKFQTDPCGVEATVTEMKLMATIRFRRTLVGLKQPYSHQLQRHSLVSDGPLWG